MARAPATAAVRMLAGEREPVRVATATNIALQGLPVIDGVQMAVNDRVLVKNQTDQRLNGIYTASEGKWYRAADANFSRAVTEGVTVHVQEGQSQAGQVWRFSSDMPRIGTDPIQISFYLSARFSEDAQSIIEGGLDSLLLLEGILQSNLTAEIDAAQASAIAAVGGATLGALDARDDAVIAAAEAAFLVQQATSGFSGFEDGQAYDLGSVADPLTFFNRDLGML